MSVLKVYNMKNNRKRLVKSNANTADVINEILRLDKKLPYLEAPLGNFERSEAGLRDLYYKVKHNVDYVLDGNDQIIKDPSQTWKNRNCRIRSKSCGADCKSFSTLLTRHLIEMDIPYEYHLVTIDPKKPKHFYPVAILDNKRYVLDATPGHRFNSEGNYVSKTVFQGQPLSKQKVGIDDRALPKRGSGILGFFVFVGITIAGLKLLSK